MESLTHRTEQALLGAMITNPALVVNLSYLEPEDFDDARHRTVYRALVLATGEAGMTEPGWRHSTAGTGIPLISAQHADELAAACPVPEHAAAYGALLVQARLHRQLAERGGQLAVQAEALGKDARRVIIAGGVGGQQAEQLGDHLKLIAGAFTYHAARIGPAPGHNGHDPQAGPGSQPGAHASMTRQVATPHWIDLAAEGQRRAERSVLTALLNRHPDSGQVISFLPVAAFTDGLRQEIFQAIRSLHTARRPVDELTTAWELTRRSAPADSGSSSYVTRLARADAGGESPIKAATLLLTRLDRRTNVSQAPVPGPVEDARPAIKAPTGHQAPRLQLVQPPPGTVSPNAGPQPRI